MFINCKMCFTYCLLYKKRKSEKVNYILITLFILILTSCGDSTKVDNTLNSNKQKEKTISDSAYPDIEKTYDDNQNDTISLTEAFNLEFDTLNKKPSVTNRESIISDVPAATYTGRYVIINTYEYSCCFYDGNFLCLYDMAQDKIVQQIKVYPAEDIEWAVVTFDSVRIQVREMINAKNYYTMTFIHKDSIKITKQNSGVDLSIEINFSNKIYNSKTFKTDSIEYGNSRCCLGFIENDYVCKIFPRIMNIWMDARERMILLEYGVIHGANGCDRGPFFKTVEIIENE